MTEFQRRGLILLAAVGCLLAGVGFSSWIKSCSRAEPESEAKTATAASEPSPYWIDEGVQYFPTGLEFKLTREAQKLREARRDDKTKTP